MRRYQNHRRARFKILRQIKNFQPIMPAIHYHVGDNDVVRFFLQLLFCFRQVVSDIASMPLSIERFAHYLRVLALVIDDENVRRSNI